LALSFAQVASAKFQRRKFFQAADDSVTAEFLSLFHRYGYIYKPLSGGSWFSAKDEWRLTDTEILKSVACKHSRYFLGARSGKTTRFAVLDIDQRSRLHNRAALDSLIKVLLDAGLSEPMLYRSSDSGGWHLYIFFDEPVPSKEVHRVLTQLLKSNGYAIQQGTLEIFPNPGTASMGCGLRLPLQPGWAWLDSNTLDAIVDRAALTPEAAVRSFMSDARDFGNSPDQYEELKRHIAELSSGFEAISESLERAMRKPVQREQIADRLSLAGVLNVFGDIPPGIRADIWWRGRSYFENGLTGPGQRADAIFSLGHYLFYGDPERVLEPLGYGYENERRHAVTSILAAKNHGHSKDLNRGRADAVVQIDRATKWLPAHKKATEIHRYKKLVPIAWVRHNDNLKAKSVERIKNALTGLVAAAKPFTVNELMEKAGIKSLQTLYAHKALWHAIYRQLKLLPSDITDEYNAVVGVASSESGTPPSDSSKDMPPGRLAARRVVLELARKTQTDKGNGQKYIESISDRYIHSWKSKVLAALPPDLSRASVRELKTSVPIVVALIAGAPDEENQIWLQEQLQIIRLKLEEARKNWAETRDQTLLLSG
jgi:hypothetical protein